MELLLLGLGCRLRLRLRPELLSLLVRQIFRCVMLTHATTELRAPSQAAGYGPRHVFGCVENRGCAIGRDADDTAATADTSVHVSQLVMAGSHNMSVGSVLALTGALQRMQSVGRLRV